MENKIVLDTDFLINQMRNGKEENNFIKGIDDNTIVATTTVNLFELYYGAAKTTKKEDNINYVDNIAEQLKILHIDQKIAKIAGVISAELDKKGKMLDFKDLLIGTIAKENGYALKTNNKKHFSMLEGLKLL